MHSSCLSCRSGLIRLAVRWLAIFICCASCTPSEKSSRSSNARLHDHVILNTEGLTSPQIGYLISVPRSREAVQWPVNHRLFFNQFEYICLVSDGFVFIRQSPLSLGHSSDFFARRYAKNGTALTDGLFSTAEGGIPVGMVRALVDSGEDGLIWVDGVLWVKHVMSFEDETVESTLEGRAIFFDSKFDRRRDNSLFFAPLDWSDQDPAGSDALSTATQLLEVVSLEPYYQVDFVDGQWLVRWDAELLSDYLDQHRPKSHDR